MTISVHRIILAIVATALLTSSIWADDEVPPMNEIQVVSSLDGTTQPSLLWAPPTAKKHSTPILIWLHSWSSTYHQKDAAAYLQQSLKRGWILLLPNFRGRNDRPEAAGSELARADIIDALDFVQQQFDVDATRIYLAGGSGGGHMALLMAGYHPDRFSAVSAWVPITDLADWYRHSAPSVREQYAKIVLAPVGGLPPGPGVGDQYAKNVLAVCGGPPGASPTVDGQYRSRSPIYHLDNIHGSPVDIAAGLRDFAVPIEHSVRVYNRIAATRGVQQVSKSEIQQLVTKGKLDQPRASDRITNASYGYPILLRRHAGNTRLTIFDGGHVMLPEASAAWLAVQQRVTEKRVVAEANANWAPP